MLSIYRKHIEIKLLLSINQKKRLQIAAAENYTFVLLCIFNSEDISYSIISKCVSTANCNKCSCTCIF